MTRYYQISETGYPIVSNTMIDGFIAYEVGAEPIDLKNTLLAQEQKEAITRFEIITTDFIESKVQAYNDMNGLAFKNIDAFPKYALNTSSQHHAIANQFIAYADNVWKAVRAYQSTLTVIPTDAEFQAVLDGVTF